LLDNVKCDVNTADELDAEIRKIFVLDQNQRGDEICGRFNVDYSDESVKRASLVPLLESRDVRINWRKKTTP
jgi:hypothetical protein